MRYQFTVNLKNGDVLKRHTDAVGICSAQNKLVELLISEGHDYELVQFAGFGPAIWKPTQAECDLLKKAAAKETGHPLKHLRLTMGVRYNTDQPDLEGVNWLMVSKLVGDAMGDDTDLVSDTDWETFRKGVLLTEDGKAVVDFYIRPINEATADKHHYDHLMGNVVAHYEDGKLTHIAGNTKFGHNWLEELM
jgi:hypothetical protein